MSNEKRRDVSMRVSFGAEPLSFPPPYRIFEGQARSSSLSSQIFQRGGEEDSGKRRARRPMDSDWRMLFLFGGRNIGSLSIGLAPEGGNFQ